MAEHRDADAPAADRLERPPCVSRHADDRRSRVVEHGSRDRVEAEDVDDRMQHEDVALADERREGATSGCARRDDQLRNADRKCAHGRSAEDRTPSSAEAEGLVEPPLEPEPEADGPDALLHQLDSRAAAPRRANLVELVPALACDLGARDVRDAVLGLAENPGVDDDRNRIELAQAAADVLDLSPLRVERPDERDAGRVPH